MRFGFCLDIWQTALHRKIKCLDLTFIPNLRKPKKPCIGLCYLKKIGKINKKSDEEDEEEEEDYDEDDGSADYDGSGDDFSGSGDYEDE